MVAAATLLLLLAWGCLASLPYAQQQPPSIGLPAIYVLDHDDSMVALVAKLPGMKWHGSPCWSHDGKRLAFDATPVDMGWNQCHVFVVAVEGPEKNVVKDLGCGNSPSWSPDDQQLAFHIQPDNPIHASSGIWAMNADGTDRRQLCNSGGRPRWSPDGKKIVVWGLAILDVQNEEPAKANELVGVLEQEYLHSDGATWSPDSKRLAFVGINRQNGDHELCIVDADGARRSLRVLWRGNLGGQIPAWSPDGKTIVFWIQAENGVRRLHAIPPDAPGLPIMIDQGPCGVWNADPAWSPDGKKIVFSSDRVENNERETPTLETNDRNAPRGESAMPTADVVAMADRETPHREYEVARRETPRIEHEFHREDQTWSVFYEGKEKRSGNRFSVWINDVTGECRLVPEG